MHNAGVSLRYVKKSNSLYESERVDKKTKILNVDVNTPEWANAADFNHTTGTFVSSVLLCHVLIVSWVFPNHKHRVWFTTNGNTRPSYTADADVPTAWLKSAELAHSGVLTSTFKTFCFWTKISSSQEISLSDRSIEKFPCLQFFSFGVVLI